MIKKTYAEPEIELIRYAEEDILNASPPEVQDPTSAGKDLPEQDP
jgi:hypothetical protein